MYAIPNVIDGDKLDSSGKYLCPLCRVQKAGDDADTGWVSCPMISGEMICLGSCIDHQRIAVSENFAEHFDVELFERLSVTRVKTVKQLRVACLEHQVTNIDLQLERSREDEAELSALRLLLLERLKQV